MQEQTNSNVSPEIMTHAMDIMRLRAQAFVKQNHIGPNSPCPCGKLRPDGKPMKFKKCCQKKIRF